MYHEGNTCITLSRQKHYSSIIIHISSTNDGHIMIVTCTIQYIYMYSTVNSLNFCKECVLELPNYAVY